MSSEKYVISDVCDYKIIDKETGNILLEGKGGLKVETGETVINIPSVASWTITDLRYTCRENKVKGYTKMAREELIEAVNNIINNYKKDK